MKKYFLIFCTIAYCSPAAHSQRSVSFAARAESAITSFTNESGNEVLSGMLDGMQKGIAAGNSMADNPLSLDECVPDFSEDLSSITASCNGEPTCYDCFNRTLEKLDFYRRQLARLRCIYNNTKTYKDAAIAIGDNTSGIHAMAGIAWQKERGKIMNTFENTKRIYDEKSQLFIRGLYDTLKELDTCMYTVGEDNWYVKSGFIYFDFMKERYKRND